MCANPRGSFAGVCHRKSIGAGNVRNSGPVHNILITKEDATHLQYSTIVRICEDGLQPPQGKAQRMRKIESLRVFSIGKIELLWPGSGCEIHEDCSFEIA